MTGKILLLLALSSIIAVFEPKTANAALDTAKMSQKLKDSLVNLRVSKHGYEQIQPWKRSDVYQDIGYGCAVGPYQVLTTAVNLTNAVFIKAQRSGQNEFIPATITVLDYQSNLCLLQLRPEALDVPLKPLKFDTRFTKDTQLTSFWLSPAGYLTSGRGYLDRAMVQQSPTSFAKLLAYTVVNTSKPTARGEIYYDRDKPIGIASYAGEQSKQAKLIPAAVINKFLADTRDGKYKGFPIAGFSTKSLLDPAMRKYLKLPDNIKNGVYISKVYTLGTASKDLLQGDVLLAIDNKKLNAYGRYSHPKYDKVFYHDLLATHSIGDKITFDIWRDGEKKRLNVSAEGISNDQMLIPYHEYDQQPEYLVIGGFVFQKLTKSYLQMWGDQWTGNSPPHLYHYFRDMAFKPTPQRQEVILLSFVLPVPPNQGYQRLRSLVVSTVNGVEITGFNDFLQALETNAFSPFHVIKFEHDNPTVVIPKENLQALNELIEKNYGITNPKNIIP